MRSTKNQSNYMKQLRINYLRQETVDEAENQSLLATYEESLEIEGEIQVQYA